MIANTTSTPRLVAIPLVCPGCGHTSQPGDEVREHVAYVGGQGIVNVVGCIDESACARRHDRADGITHDLDGIPTSVSQEAARLMRARKLGWAK